MNLDREICYRALVTRDARFDGRFYTGVLSTGIYCRPICPARTPKLEHCQFLPSAAAAHRAGFRPCLRCRPEIAPGLAGWRGTESTVRRALGLISEGALDDEGDVDHLATRLGVGARHLRRLFDRHVGAPPIAVAQAHRILFAKKLLDETAMPIAQVAFTAGFGSVRRFNHVMRRTYGRAPGELRRASAGRDSADAAGITLRLPFTPPYDWENLLGFLAARAIPGVESIAGGRYRRTIAIGDAVGSVDVRRASGADHLLATVRISDLSVLSTVIARLRRLFDLDADICAIEEHLMGDPLLAPHVRAHAGVRVPGAWDAFELMVRAILGQQVSVAAATTMAGRLASRFGTPLAGATEESLAVLFPGPEVLVSADLTEIGLIRARADAITALASAAIADPTMLSPYTPVEATVAKLEALRGVGSWTAAYIAMRALREPDAFPSADLALRRAMDRGEGKPSPAALASAAEHWRPWRAYAAMHLWMNDTDSLTPIEEKP